MKKHKEAYVLKKIRFHRTLNLIFEDNNKICSNITTLTHNI